MRVEDLGHIPYDTALALQEQAVSEVIEGGEERLFLLEHPPVITLGTGGGAENLHVSEAWLRAQGVAVHRTRRGGNITCHFPGQLVAYPILRLEKRPGGLRRYFHDLEETVIRLLARHGVAAGREENRTGVWVDHGAECRKVCSMGVAVRRWVSYHGLALNVDRDISLFDAITLCGLHGAAATSLYLELDRLQQPPQSYPTMDDVKHELTQEIRALLAPS